MATHGTLNAGPLKRKMGVRIPPPLPLNLKGVQMPKISKVYSISDDDFRNLIAKCNSFCECAKELGMSTSGANSYLQLKKRIQELDCDTSHFSLTKNVRKVSTKYPLSAILVEDSIYANRSCLKKRILDEGLLEYKCAICGNQGMWNNKVLNLQLDHINGKNNDHRLENLRFLCPNCHSQTETFSGRNKE